MLLQVSGLYMSMRLQQTQYGGLAFERAFIFTRQQSAVISHTTAVSSSGERFGMLLHKQGQLQNHDQGRSYTCLGRCDHRAAEEAAGTPPPEAHQTPPRLGGREAKMPGGECSRCICRYHALN